MSHKDFFKKLGRGLEDVAKVAAAPFIAPLAGIAAPIAGIFDAQKKAGDAVAQGAAQAQDLGQQQLDFARDVYGQVRADQQPFRDASVNALTQLQNFNPEGVLSSPLANRLLALRQRTIENSAAARGNLNSVNTLQNVANDASSFGLNLIGNEQNRLLNLAGFRPGVGGTISSAQPVSQGFSNLGNIAMQQGQIAAENKIAPINTLLQLGNTAGNLAGLAGL